jgi:acyl carrier protein
MSGDRLAAVSALVLKVPAERLSDQTSPDNTPSWDSLAAMELVSQIEETFGVQLSTREIMKMRSLGLAREMLRSKGALDV